MLDRHRRSVSALAVALSIAWGAWGTSSAWAEDAVKLPALDAGATLFVHVHVVPIAGESTLDDSCVRVLDGRIVAIDRALAPRDGERVIDGRGDLWLVPGLVDMHLHLPPDDGATDGPAKRALSLLLANGVTTVRGLAGNAKHPALRERVAKGELLGPTLYIAGNALHVGNVKTADDAIAAVKAQKSAGFDLIKSHHIVDPTIWAAIETTAHELAIPVAGHVTTEVGLDRVLEAGQQVEHLDGFLAALATSLEGLPEFGQFPPAALFTSGGPQGRIDESRLAPLVARFASSRLPNTPTLALFERVVDGSATTEVLSARAEMKYIPPAARSNWSKRRDEMSAHGFPEEGVAEPFVALRRRIVLALDAADAPILVGSDCPQEFFVEGFATHDEMEALERAGIPAPRVLRAATRTPARYFAALPKHGSTSSLEADFGSIEIGKRADFVLLRASPLTSIANTREIEGVMLRGKWLDRATLDALLATAESLAR